MSVDKPDWKNENRTTTKDYLRKTLEDQMHRNSELLMNSLINTKKLVEGSNHSLDNHSQSGSIISKKTTSFSKTGGMTDLKFSDQLQYTTRYDKGYNKRYKTSGQQNYAATQSKFSTIASTSTVYQRQNAHRLSTPTQLDREEIIKSLINQNVSQKIEEKCVSEQIPLINNTATSNNPNENKEHEEDTKKPKEGQNIILELANYQKVTLRSRGTAAVANTFNSQRSLNSSSSDLNKIKQGENTQMESHQQENNLHSSSKINQERLSLSTNQENSKKPSPFLKSLRITTDRELSILDSKIVVQPPAPHQNSSKNPNLVQIRDQAPDNNKSNTTLEDSHLFNEIKQEVIRRSIELANSSGSNKIKQHTASSGQGNDTITM